MWEDEGALSKAHVKCACEAAQISRRIRSISAAPCWCPAAPKRAETGAVIVRRSRAAGTGLPIALMPNKLSFHQQGNAQPNPSPRRPPHFYLKVQAMSELSATMPPLAATRSAAPSARWVQLAAGVLCMMAVSSPQYVWTLFTKPLQTQFGVPLSQLQITFSILIVLQTFLSPFQGFLVERFGPRMLLSVGALLTGGSWVLAAQATPPPTMVFSTLPKASVQYSAVPWRRCCTSKRAAGFPSSRWSLQWTC